MRYTSINHTKLSNYQVDFQGSEHDAIATFESWAHVNGAIWAHLFEEKTGRQVATFDNVQGLSRLA